MKMRSKLWSSFRPHFECGDIVVNNIKLDFGEIDPNERVNGLIGLDYLRCAGVILDLVDLIMYILIALFTIFSR